MRRGDCCEQSRRNAPAGVDAAGWAGAPAAGAGAGVIAASAMRAKNAASSGAAFSATTRSGVTVAAVLRRRDLVQPLDVLGVVGQVADQDDPRASEVVREEDPVREVEPGRDARAAAERALHGFVGKVGASPGPVCAGSVK